jgi:GDP-mannose 6-dehydrogenase
LHAYVYGCGFAGIISALGLCQNGVRVTGFDIDPDRIQDLSRGSDPQQEPLIRDLLRKHQGQGLHFCHTESLTDKNLPDFHLLTLPTPLRDGTLDISIIEQSCRHILSVFGKRQKPQIVVRSTLPIGGLASLKNSLAEKLKFQAGVDYHIIYMPEFMREGTGLDDWNNPPLFIVGVDESDTSFRFSSAFCKQVPISMASNEAEAVKLFSNAFHALKVTFANEVYRVCSAEGVSADSVMSTICKDTKLNISDKYLRPGFAWGGGCLGKDTRALNTLRADLPVLSQIVASNEKHVEFYKALILSRAKHASIGFLSLSFKDNVSDFRDSPILKLIGFLCKEKCVDEILIFDPIGQNQALGIADIKVKWVNRPEELNTCDLVLGRPTSLAALKSAELSFKDTLHL